METGVRTATIVPNSRWKVFRSATSAPHATTPATTANIDGDDESSDGALLASKPEPGDRCSEHDACPDRGLDDGPLPGPVERDDALDGRQAPEAVSGHAGPRPTWPGRSARRRRPNDRIPGGPSLREPAPHEAIGRTERPIASKVAAIPATTVAASPMCVAISAPPMAPAMMAFAESTPGRRRTAM